MTIESRSAGPRRAIVRIARPAGGDGGGAREILLRQISLADGGALAALLARVSPESAYRRFHAAKRGLTDGELRYLSDVDHRDHEAIVAVDQEIRVVVGVARYVRRHDDRRAAEVAVLVHDDWQGRGLGRALLRQLAEEACANGIQRFSALVLADNRRALRMFGRRRLRSVRDGPTVEVEVELASVITGEGAAARCEP